MTNPQPLGSWQKLMATFDWNSHKNMGDLAPFIQRLGDLPNTPGAGPVQRWEVIYAVPTGPVLEALGPLLGTIPGVLGWVAQWPAEVSLRLRDEVLA